jgi:hypothetical protein
MSKTQPKRAFLVRRFSPRAPQQVFRDVREDHAGNRQRQFDSLRKTGKVSLARLDD